MRDKRLLTVYRNLNFLTVHGDVRVIDPTSIRRGALTDARAELAKALDPRAPRVLGKRKRNSFFMPDQALFNKQVSDTWVRPAANVICKNVTFLLWEVPEGGGQYFEYEGGTTENPRIAPVLESVSGLVIAVMDSKVKKLGRLPGFQDTFHDRGILFKDCPLGTLLTVGRCGNLRVTGPDGITLGWCKTNPVVKMHEDDFTLTGRDMGNESAWPGHGAIPF